MDTAQWPQEIVVKQMEEILIPMNSNTSCSNSNANSANEKSISMERKMKPHQNTQLVNCPRCNSTNTKFCYYNNYSLSQPRYFCKGCRRYWTEGGTLRNIPVGGGSRKNKKTTSSKKINPSLVLPQLPITTTNNNHNTTATTAATATKYENQGKDLNLGYDFETISRLIQVPSFENIDNKSRLSALELFNGDSNNSYMPMPVHNENNGSLYSEGFSSLPTLSFSLDGIGNSGSNGRVMFPFEDLKQVSSTNDLNRDQQGDSTGYWNGVLGGGSW